MNLKIIIVNIYRVHRQWHMQAIQIRFHLREPFVVALFFQLSPQLSVNCYSSESTPIFNDQ